jgi:nucleoside-diphosphate-sugar epimerase
MDISRLGELGFVPRYGLRAGLHSYLDWLRENDE